MKNMLSVVCFLLFTIESCYCLAVTNPLKIGEFKNYHHDIGGTVYILDNETLFTIEANPFPANVFYYSWSFLNKNNSGAPNRYVTITG